MIKKIKMIFPKSDWKLDNSYGHDRIINKDGYYMFTDCAGVCMNNDKHDKKKIEIGFVEWLVFSVFANWRVQSLTGTNKMKLFKSLIMPVFAVLSLSSILLIL